MVPPTRIERATRGLGIASKPTSDNLNSQETTNQATGEVGTDGPGLSCPGSSVVAESGRGSVPLIKSPAEDLPQDTQQNESAGKGEDS
jgi:hypothetical protein